VSQRQKQVTNQKRARRLGTGEGIRPEKPKRSGGGIPMWVWLVLGAAVLLAVGVGAVVVTRSDGSSSGADSPVVQDRLQTTKPDFQSVGTWDPNYTNLAGALTALQLPGLSESVEHYHVHLKILADGHNVVVPQNMGLDATNQVYSPIHTHDERGVIHIEADTKDFVATLGEVFDVWGVKFDKDCLGGFCDGVKVYVNGKQVDQYADLPLHSHDAVTVVAGAPPKDFTPPSTFKFAPGE
jgi:hypothetical protein